MNWSYENITYKDLDAAIKACEQIIEYLGGVAITEHINNEIWVMNKDTCITEQVKRRRMDLEIVLYL